RIRPSSAARTQARDFARREYRLLQQIQSPQRTRKRRQRTFDRRGKAFGLSLVAPNTRFCGNLPATLAKARLRYVSFPTRLINSAALHSARRLIKAAPYRSGWAGRAMLQIDAAGTASIALFEHLSRHEHPRAASAQRVSPQRHLIARQHDQGDEDVLAQTAGAFSHRHRCRRRNDLESVAADQPHHLVVTLAASELHGATHERNVVKVGARGEIARELPQRVLEAKAHLPRPCNRCALLRHRRDLLVPQMQIDEALADVARRAVRKHEVLLQTADFDAQNASRVVGIFDDGLPAAQYAVQPKDDLVQRQPDQSPLPQFIHGIGGLTARLLQYYNPLICTGFQPA